MSAERPVKMPPMGVLVTSPLAVFCLLFGLSTLHDDRGQIQSWASVFVIWYVAFGSGYHLGKWWQREHPIDSNE